MTEIELFQAADVQLTLRRWPHRRQERLRAWDGADRLLIETASTNASGPVWVLNDVCGALALGQLARGNEVYAVGDSWVAREALHVNAAANALPMERLHWSWQPKDPPFLPGCVLMRSPKSLSLLESQLDALSGLLPVGTPVYVGAMDKHVPRRLMTLLDTWIGAPAVGRGQYKAHVYRAAARGARPDVPARSESRVFVPALGCALQGEDGVFSQDQLDPGARFMLAHMPDVIEGDVADLGCGNGVLGIAAAGRSRTANIWFFDESAAAIRSARSNAESMQVMSRCTFCHGNGMDGVAQLFDLILLNPPFHRGHAVDTQVAEMLFDHARRHLRADGRLLVVGNRHLAYAATLRRRFGRVVQVATSARFTVWEARPSVPQP